MSLITVGVLKNDGVVYDEMSGVNYYSAPAASYSTPAAKNSALSLHGHKEQKTTRFEKSKNAVGALRAMDINDPKKLYSLII